MAARSLILLTNCAGAATWIVDPTPGVGNYTSIQDAINESTAGDTIQVQSGTYYEHVVVNKRLTLQGTDTGSGLPVIDGNASGSAIALSANNCTLQDFVAMSSGQSGIIVASSYNTVLGNTATGSGYGIVLSSSSNGNTVSGNTATGNTNYGIYLSSSTGNTITGNIANGSDTGISISGSSGNTISNNTANSNDIGIELPSSSGNTISGNTATNNIHYGIALTSSSGNTISGNTINGNSRGIYIITTSNSNSISNNTATSNGIGIDLSSSTGNTISGNTIGSNKEHGIRLESSSSSTLSGNIANFNAKYGIQLKYSNGNTISSNTASGNSLYGIYLDSSSSNIIYLNTFDNTNNARSNGANHWNATSSQSYEQGGQNLTGLLGNIWSDYEGFDCDGDGVGETPYDISGGSEKDYHPLGGREAAASMEVEKLADMSLAEAGEWISYTVFVNNTGNINLTNVRARDNLTGAVWELGTLKRGQNYTNTSSYRVKLTDFPGPLVNELRANGTSESCGGEVNDSAIETVMVKYNCTYGPRTHTVCASGCNYTTIQAAINDACPGDTILVQSGTYNENVNVNKTLTLRGINWPVVRNRLPGAAITLSADSCILEGFIARDSSYGIRAMSNNNIISGNNATKNSYGFQLASSNGNTVSDNNAFDNTGYGIYVVNSSSNEILDNRFIGSDTRNGICLSDSSCNNNIIGNTATGNKGAGILLQINSNSNTISGNNVSGNSDNGIYGYCSYNTISDNKITGNSPCGIRTGGTGNIISGNDATGNSQYSIMLVWGEGCRIWLNTFDSGYSNNILGRHAWNSTTNITWEYGGRNLTGYLGNIWTDYVGLDCDGDGVGDTPYNIAVGKEKDFHPIGGLEVSPSLEAKKLADRAEAEVGDWINYTIWVNNTGNVNLSNVRAWDNLTGAVLVLGTMQPGQNYTNTTSYQVNLTDLPGPLTNELRANSTDPCGREVNNTTIETVEIQYNCIDGYKLDTLGNGLPDWTIFVDEDGDGILDPGESSNVTDSSGYWQICGLDSGSVVNVTEISQTGWRASQPSAGWQSVPVQPNNMTDYINFTNQNVTCIQGYKLDDSGEPLEGWTIFIDGNSKGALDAAEPSDITDSNGYWQICGLDAGSEANVTELAKSGWRPSIPPTGWQTIAVLANNSTADVNFTNQNVTCIDGYKLDDSGEPLEGWTIFIDGNSNGALDADEASDITDSNGYWVICGLDAGSEANVTELAQSGWRPSIPPTGWQTITVLVNNSTADVNFTNQNVTCTGGEEFSGEIQVEKLADRSEAEVGDWINYTIWVNNTGNVTLTGVRTEDNLTMTVWEVGTLNPSQNYTNTTRYQVKETDLPGPLVNELWANGTNPCGFEVNDSAMETVKVKYNCTYGPRTHTVCASGCNYTTIQAAINDACPGDTILVQSGTYSERVVVNKTLTLQGVGSPVVDAGGLGNAFTLSAPN